MGIMRGRVYLDREVRSRHIEVGGPKPFRKCECGKWISRETGKHVEVVELNLKQFLERFGSKCPDAQAAQGEE